jgi:hypothetical protein
MCSASILLHSLGQLRTMVAYHSVPCGCVTSSGCYTAKLGTEQHFAADPYIGKIALGQIEQNRLKFHHALDTKGGNLFTIPSECCSF